MQLRSKALLSAGVVTVLTAVFAVVVFAAVLDIRNTARQLREVQIVRERLLSAEALVGDFILSRSPRALRQWRILHGRIVEDVEHMDATLDLSAGRHAELRDRLAAMAEEFRGVVRRAGPNDLRPGLHRSRLRANGQAVAARLGEIAAELEHRENRTLVVVSVVLTGIIVILVALSVAYYVATRVIVGRALDEVGGAVAAIGAGRLDDPITTGRRDEIGALLRALETMRAMLARNRRELESEREKAESLGQAKTQFLATMSHEIRTPLNGVMGAVYLLRGTPVDETQQRYLAMAESSGQTLLSVVNDVLDFSKIESGGLELDDQSFRPDLLVDEVISMFGAAAREKGIALEHELAFDGTVRGDPLRLRQILINLVSNAVKFTERGKVTVTLTGAPEADGRRALCMVVRDTGIGIPEEARDVIFDPFRQSDGSMTRRFGGTGLGLAIARRLAQTMGGRLDVESAEGVGSRFTLRVALPVGDGTEPAGSSRVDVARPLRLTVLVVEDIEINRVIVGEILGAFGCTVSFAATGREAVAMAGDECFDAILMDIHMPDMDGLDATRLIRSGGGPCAEAPIIGLTADAFTEQHARFLAAGMSDVLTKPVDPDRLWRRLAEVEAGGVDDPPSPQDGSDGGSDDKSAARERAAR